MSRVHEWWTGTSKVNVPKNKDPVRFGVLGAADFSPIGLFRPAKSHPDVVVVAIGARSLTKAQAQAKKFGVPRAFGSYGEVIQQDDIDAVYIPLPIRAHAEWAINAMRAGKHVLIEKAITVNAEEAIRIRNCAQETGKIAMEAFHWQFHPVNNVVKSIIDSKRYGDLLSTSASLWAPSRGFGPDDIRLQYATGGGACLDLAYIFSSTMYFAGGKGKYEVLDVKHRPTKRDAKVDERVEANMLFHPEGSDRTIKCHVVGDLDTPKHFGIIGDFSMPLFKAELEQANIVISKYYCQDLQVVSFADNVVASSHHISVTRSQSKTSVPGSSRASSNTLSVQSGALARRLGGRLTGTSSRLSS
jgi:predicted dehydrogenase